MQMAQGAKPQELEGGDTEQQRQLIGTETSVEHMETATGERVHRELHYSNRCHVFNVCSFLVSNLPLQSGIR